MLLTGLKGHAKGMVTIGINRHTYNPSRHTAFQFIPCGKEASVRAAVAHWQAEALIRPVYYVCTPFARRCQQCKAHQVSSRSHESTGSMSLLNKIMVVTYLTAG